MSRCFPYPPPGYVCNRATTDALIESIKIESEKNKVKQERKEQKRRDKEQKKKEKKEKNRVKEKLKSTQNTDGITKRKRESGGIDDSVFKSSANSKELLLQKINVPEAEQLERSSLEEEYGQPVLPEGLCYSSDGTQSKTKRCKIELSPSNASCTTQGKVIRFRLKRREPESAQLITNDMLSTSGRTGNSDTEMFDASVKDEPCVVSSVPKPNEDTKGFVSRPVVQSAKDSGKLPICNPSGEKIQKPKSAYEALLDSWVPPSIHFGAIEGGGDDENWLFQSKKPTEQTSESLKAYDGLSVRQSTSLWPRAQLLPEVDLFVLPFTVPF